MELSIFLVYNITSLVEFSIKMEEYMKKRFYITGLIFFLISLLWGEVRYIEIDSIKDVPVIEIKSVEDFETIINEYGIKIGYLQKNTTESFLFVIADSVYFSFPLKGYYSLSDYKTGSEKKFKNGTDYNKALSLGFDSSEIYYYYIRNSFTEVEDCKDAYKNGFVNIQDNLYLKKSESAIYYEARNAGYVTYSDYKDYVEYTKAGFKNKSDWQAASQKGFKSGESYYSAVENGFSNNTDYSSAKKLGISNYEDYKNYTNTIESIELIMKERSLEKKPAVIYYYIQSLPKGDIGLSALSSFLNDLYFKQSKNVTDAIDGWYSSNKKDEESNRNKKGFYNTNTTIISVGTIFSQKELSFFFNQYDSSSLGNYNAKTEIFRRK